MQRHGYQMPGCPRKRAITSASRAGIDVMVNGSVMQTKVTEARESSSPSTINQSTEARFIKPRASSVSARRHAPLVFGVRAGRGFPAVCAAGESPEPITRDSRTVLREAHNLEIRFDSGPATNAPWPGPSDRRAPLDRVAICVMGRDTSPAYLMAHHITHSGQKPLHKL